MKKLFLGLFITLTIAAIHGCDSNAPEVAQVFDSATAKKNVAADKRTLNGFSFDVADDMVNGYLRNRFSMNAQTTNWFSADYVNNLSKLLDSEKADGFRIYFARNSSDKTYNIIMVSTHEDSILIDNKYIKIHQDYFDHNTTLLNTPQSLIGHGTAIRGAITYNPAMKCVPPCVPPPTKHYINCDQAKTWIGKMLHETEKDTIKTISEWFDIKLLQSINAELKAGKDNAADGIRIYFAKKSVDEHCFIIITTKLVTKWFRKSHQDYHECYNKTFITADDNGEQCPNNCYGVTWPDSLSLKKYKK